MASSAPASTAHHVIVGGTGAVGSVVADTLIRCRHRVTLYLKPRHAERLQRRRYASIPASIAIYDHNARQRNRLLTSACVALATAAILTVFYHKSALITVSLSLLLLTATFLALPHSIAPFHIVSAFDVLTAPAALPPSCSHLWLCISSSDLHADDAGMASLLSSLPAQAVVMTASPSPGDVPFVLSLFPHPSRVLLCMPAFLAYQAPLAAEEIPATHDANADAPPGIAVYFPPLVRSAVWGEDNRAAQALVQALNAGGMPATAERVSRPAADRPQSQSRSADNIPIAFLNPLLLALELSSWSLAQLFSPPHAATLRLCTAAVRQLMSPAHPLLSSLLPCFLAPSSFRALLFFCLSFLPFDGEAWLVYHGTKLSDQTIRILAEMEDGLAKQGRDAAAVSKLRQRVLRRRGEEEQRYGVKQ